MSYVLNKTDGTVLVTLFDGTTNTDTGLTLIGRNYVSYGEIQNENFIRLLENFASTLPPGQSVGFTPIAGQLWWDTANQRLRVYTGTEFIAVSEQSVGATAPESSKTGDQWWDTVNQQLKVNNGSGWTVIAPGYTAIQGKSGAVVETVTDTGLSAHTVVNNYTNNHLISVTSYDPTFQTGAYDQFSFIRPGINLASNVMIHGSVSNAVALNGIYGNAYARSNVATSFSSDVTVLGNIVLGSSSANISYINNILRLTNKTLNANLCLYVTTPLGVVEALQVNGTNGLITVAGHPTNAMGIATKNYVDQTRTTLDTAIISNASVLNTSINTLRNNTDANLAVQVISQNANLTSVQTGINSNVATLTSLTDTKFTLANANAAVQAAAITSINNQLPYFAPYVSPFFSGNPRVPVVEELINHISSLDPRERPFLLNVSDMGLGDGIDAIDVTVGDIVNLVWYANGYPVTDSSLEVMESGNVSAVKVADLNGTLTTGIQPLFGGLPDKVIALNGTRLTPDTHLVSVTALGPQLANIGLGNNSDTIATTSYVDTTANILHRDYNSKITNAVNIINSTLATQLPLKANVANPTFTGTPSAPTPGAGDNSTQIATTAFVRGAITGNLTRWQGSRYTVSTNPPSGGDNGDFWFQIG